MTDQPPPPPPVPDHPTNWGVTSAPWQGPAAPSSSYGMPSTPPSGLPSTPPSGLPYPEVHQPSFYPLPQPDTNGLAVAALVLGLVGIPIPVAAIVALVLGLVALSQIRSRPQQGRGMAISGVSLGVFSILAWTALFAFVIVVADGDEDGESRARGAGSSVSVDSLASGECFDGLDEGSLSSVTLRPCEGPHQAQVITAVTLPAGPWPGREEVVALSEDRCLEQMEGLVHESFADELDVFTLYPESALAWKLGRTATCVVVATDGVIGTSVLIERDPDTV